MRENDRFNSAGNGSSLHLQAEIEAIDRTTTVAARVLSEVASIVGVYGEAIAGYKGKLDDSEELFRMVESNVTSLYGTDGNGNLFGGLNAAWPSSSYLLTAASMPVVLLKEAYWDKPFLDRRSYFEFRSPHEGVLRIAMYLRTGLYLSVVAPNLPVPPIGDLNFDSSFDEKFRKAFRIAQLPSILRTLRIFAAEWDLGSLKRKLLDADQAAKEHARRTLFGLPEKPAAAGLDPDAARESGAELMLGQVSGNGPGKKRALSHQKETPKPVLKYWAVGLSENGWMLFRNLDGTLRPHGVADIPRGKETKLLKAFLDGHGSLTKSEANNACDNSGLTDVKKRLVAALRYNIARALGVNSKDVPMPIRPVTNGFVCHLPIGYVGVNDAGNPTIELRNV